MDADEALRFVEDLMQSQGQRPLSDLQRAVFQGSWDGKDYREIQRDAGQVELDHLMRNVGPRLWRQLANLISQEMGEPIQIRKDFLRGPIERLKDRMSHPVAEAPINFDSFLPNQEQATEASKAGVSLMIRREQRRAQYFAEALRQGTLEMVLIPSGSFLMGAAEEEEGASEDEYPQHWVMVPKFFISKYPITQTQWQAVAALPQVNQALDPDPSRFKGAARPVEKVSWFDAVEFCDRLSRHTHRPYRLPSEAEWEYACRASSMPTSATPGSGEARRGGTTTPFHFGETITTDLANYDGNDTYGRGLAGVYREQTTPVGSFPANAFGLYDMHGNVWEWCLDHWHDDYDNAPVDGSAWIDQNAGSNAARVLRGGSWDDLPGYCRSATRIHTYPADRNNDIGFRVVCQAPRTL